MNNTDNQIDWRDQVIYCNNEDQIQKLKSDLISQGWRQSSYEAYGVYKRLYYLDSSGAEDYNISLIKFILLQK